MKKNSLPILMLSLLLAGCDNLWSEHCIYKGYLEGHISLQDTLLRNEVFRLAYYPQSGQAKGLLDGVYDLYNEQGIAGRTVNIGSYKVISYCPGDFALRDTSQFSLMTLVSPRHWSAEAGLELTTASSRPAASDWGKGSVDIDDTCRIFMEPRRLTQHLRINVLLEKAPQGSDFRPVDALLCGVATEKRVWDGSLTGEFCSLSSPFTQVRPSLYRSDSELLGTAGAPSHLLRLECMASGKAYQYSYDLWEELHDWQSPYREINLCLKVGESLDDVEISLLGWIDKDQGDLPLFNE